mmetsp:Transcript_4111/g.8293  ORF Transcript_4111/g.8293 Transcript_4111/m.8293 type:complete len:219 (-) Transcript_4111:306-962(-)
MCLAFHNVLSSLVFLCLRVVGRSIRRFHRIDTCCVRLLRMKSFHEITVFLESGFFNQMVNLLQVFLQSVVRGPVWAIHGHKLGWIIGRRGILCGTKMQVFLSTTNFQKVFSFDPRQVFLRNGQQMLRGHKFPPLHLFHRFGRVSQVKWTVQGPVKVDMIFFQTFAKGVLGLDLDKVVDDALFFGRVSFTGSIGSVHGKWEDASGGWWWTCSLARRDTR